MKRVQVRKQVSASKLSVIPVPIQDQYKYHDEHRGYEKYRTFSLQDAAEFVPKLVREMDWNPGEYILDYGCGPGSTGFNFILPAVEKNHGRLYSVDISEKMVEFAEKEYSHPLITYRVGNVMGEGGELPWGNMKFDKILSIYVLHFIKDFRTALRRLHDLLKPGGTIGFTVLGGSGFYQLNADLGLISKWEDIMKDCRSQIVPEWEEKDGDGDMHKLFWTALEEVGFEIQTLKVLPRHWKFQSVREFAGISMAVNPIIKNLTNDQKEKIIKDLEMIIRKSFVVEEDDSMEVNYEALYVIAKRVRN